ncbi:hypothetical protein F4778DRAFT_725515 [Xylariomycetidae sp. FL2044]|nr:hypothetical protein F4778DRAFT_725515 [Xylariomycetidae sp. FL2044]
MAPTRQTNLPIDSSWRMVEEGDNDSFDTTVVQDTYDDELMPSSGQSQVSTSTSTQGFSQDSIRDFANKADEDQVILRAPFQPSLPSTRLAPHTSADRDRTPVPEFFMPTLEVDSPRRSSGRSSRTLHPGNEEMKSVRRRVFRQESSVGSSQDQRHAANARFGSYRLPERTPDTSLFERFTAAVPEFLFNSVAWALSVLGMALRYAKWPLAVLLAIYVTFGIGMIAKNLITHSISTSLSPFCRIPGASSSLPFCSGLPSVVGTRNGTEPVEFEALMNIQSQFEQVLEESARGVSLPLEMKRSEASVRDLRTVVKYSDLKRRDALVYEFDGYIATVGKVSQDLQTFNTHVGGAVDSVISINRWTSRYIDSIASNRDAKDNVISRYGSWLFSPFQPTAFDDRMLLDKYIEHTSLVSEKIASLVLEAQSALRLLGTAENHLDMIKEYVVQDNREVEVERNEVFNTLWGMLGGNRARKHHINGQLTLLTQVESQRNSAKDQLVTLLHDLREIQTQLGDLRDRVAAPEIMPDDSMIPLSTHIETINAGVERLESARRRIRAEENERYQEALRRVNAKDHMIDG